MAPLEFISKFSNAVISATMGTAIFPSVKMAQMALESSWGKHIPANNAFGIKAKGVKGPYWDGSVYNGKTNEVLNGNTPSKLDDKVISIVDGFRAYKSVTDSIKDHTYFLKIHSRYAKVFTAKTPEEQAMALEAAGYATDPDYAEKLISMINRYGLKRLDEKKKSAVPSEQ